MANPEIRHLHYGSDTQSEYIKSQFQSLSLQIVEILKATPYVSLTFDGWSAPSRKSILGITVHWVNNKFKLQEIILAVKEIDGDHSAENLVELLQKTLKDFDIIDRVFTLTADNASTNAAMARLLQPHIPDFNAKTHLLGCMAHVVNLAAQAGIKSFSKALGETDTGPAVNGLNDWLENESAPQQANSAFKRLYALITYIYKSPQRLQSFQKLAESCGLHKGFVRPVKTRWNSDLDCLERAIELKKAVNMLTIDDEYIRYAISPSEWDLLQSFTKFLRPLEEATVLLSASKSPTIADAIPTYQCLIESLDLASFLLIHLP